MFDLGIVGLATMGRSLALNFFDHGISVACWNLEPELTRALVESEPGLAGGAAESLEGLVGSLNRPRRILLMIKAGKPVDDVLASLTPLLDAGDIVIDGGNTLFHETRRRCLELKARGIEFVGLGVSGGEAGARSGPSMMAGASETAWGHLEPLLAPIAAQTRHGPCVARMGPDGAGHFVKMVHNGIEYGDMQCIAEAYDLMHRGWQMDISRIAGCFAHWNDGPLQSYLVDLTTTVLRKRDDKGAPLIEAIYDSAGQKGTGRWTVQLALDLGVAVPTISAAVDARILSSHQEDRMVLSRSPTGTSRPAPAEVDDAALTALEGALYAARICAYAQGLLLIDAGSAEFGWDVPLTAPLRVWTGGCIIRARLLDVLIDSFATTPPQANLLLHTAVQSAVEKNLPHLRRTVSSAALIGIPVPALAASLSWLEAWHSARLPQNLTQAQRDAFGAHTWQRLSDPEGPPVHSDWFS